jgi:hypothetical protein
MWVAFKSALPFIFSVFWKKVILFAPLCKTSNEMEKSWMVGKDLKGSASGICDSAKLTFVWREREKRRKKAARNQVAGQNLKGVPSECKPRMLPLHQTQCWLKLKSTRLHATSKFEACAVHCGHTVCQNTSYEGFRLPASPWQVPTMTKTDPGRLSFKGNFQNLLWTRICQCYGYCWWKPNKFTIDTKGILYVDEATGVATWTLVLI